MLGDRGETERKAREPFGQAGIQALGRWEALLALLHEYGRRAVFVVAPEKSTIYPELVPSSDPSQRCGQRASLALWHAIESRTAARDGIIGLRRPLLRLKAETRVPIYIPLDTHWNGIGSLTFAATVGPKLDPKLGLTAADVVAAAPIQRVGDLSAMKGTPKTVLVPDRAVKRSPGAPKLGGVTFVLGDSFLDLSIGQLYPFLAKASVAHWNQASPAQLSAAMAKMAASRTVVIETVERYVGIRAALITPEFLRVLRADLISANARRGRR